MTKPCDNPIYAHWLPCCDKGNCNGSKVWGAKTSNGPCPWVEKCRDYYRDRAGKLHDLEKVSPESQKLILNLLDEFNGTVLEVKA